MCKSPFSIELVFGVMKCLGYIPETYIHRTLIFAHPNHCIIRESDTLITLIYIDNRRMGGMRCPHNTSRARTSVL